MDPVWAAFWLSLKMASWATALNLVIGIGIEFLFARKRFPSREL